MQLFLSNVRQIIVATVVLTASANFGLGQIKYDPNVPDDLRAVMAINVDMKNLQEYRLFEPLVDSADVGGEAPFTPSDVARMSAFVGAPKSLGLDSLMNLDYYVYLGFHDAAVVSKVKAELMDKGGRNVTISGKKLVEPGNGEFPPGVYLEFLNSAIVIGTEPYLTSPSKQFASKNLAEAYLRLERHPVRIAVDMDGMRELLDQAFEMASADADPITKSFLPLINEASTLTITSDITKDLLLKLAVTGHDEKEAKGIKLKLDAALGLGQTSAKMLEGAPGMEDVLKTINDLEIVTSGNTSMLTVPKPKGFDQMLTGAATSAQGAARSAQDVNSFKQATLAMLNYHDTRDKFPFVEDAAGEDSNSGLSWIVHVLPYIEEGDLYNKFDMDAGYDSAQNAPLAKIELSAFKLKSGGEIRWIRPKKMVSRMREIVDGTSNTIAFVQSKKVSMLPWTKPSSMSPEEAIKQLKELEDGESFLVGMYDGSVRTIDKSMSAEIFGLMLDPADGKPIPFDR